MLCALSFAETDKRLEALQGSYIELFPEFAKDEFHDYWIQCISVYVDDPEMAEMFYQMLVGSCMGKLKGQEAIDAYTADPDSIVFDCFFLLLQSQRKRTVILIFFSLFFIILRSAASRYPISQADILLSADVYPRRCSNRSSQRSHRYPRGSDIHGSSAWQNGRSCTSAAVHPPCDAVWRIRRSDIG